MAVRQMIFCAVLLGAVIYLKFCLPGFSEEFMPLMREWLALEQVCVPIPSETMAWLGLS